MATVHPHRTRPWLVMLFLAGDNSLNEDMVLALQDIQAEGAPPATGWSRCWTPAEPARCRTSTTSRSARARASKPAA